MNVLRSIVIAFSSFSAIPMPQVEWDEANMRYMMAAFPLIGVVIGLLIWLWSLLCGVLNFGPVLCAGGFTLIPILVSGGIHMDGFADVVDAQTSHAEPARKREILKDPHTGAFAVIGVGCYLVAYFAFATEVDPRFIAVLAAAPVLSRCLSGFAVVTFKAPDHGGMYSAEKNSARSTYVRVVLVTMFAVAAAFMMWVNLIMGVLTVAAAVVVLLCVKLFADKEFGGMNGDMAGFFLQVAELTMLICIVVVGKLV